MTQSAPPRPFFAPLIGITLLFAAFGPPIGGAAFVPIALLLKAPAAAGAFALSAFVASLIGHWIMLIIAYLVGLGPATATGILFALWDAAAPDEWPRALVAAIIGGVVTYAVALRLAGLGFTLDGMFETNGEPPSAEWISAATPAPHESHGLLHAFVISGAVAGFACASAARLFGLTMRPLRLPAASGGPL
jgi:hypothetical protein